MAAGSFFPFKYLGMKSMGPGRYREIPAMMSSRLSGFSSFMKLFIPPLSSWNTPSSFPVPMDSMTFLSLKSMWSRSSFTPWSFWIMATASWSTVRVLSPRKSIFKSPSSSSVVIVNWVVMVPSEPRDRGTYSSMFVRLMTTPAACMDVCLGSPSSRLDMSMSLWTCSSVS